MYCQRALFAAALLAHAVSAATQSLWWDNRGFHRASLPETAEYQVWAWTSASNITLQLNQQSLAATNNEASGNGAFHWLHLGTTNIPAGPLAINTDAVIATIALSRAEDFNPSQAARHRRIFSQPQRVEDKRVTAARHTDTVFTMPHFESREDWENTAAELRRRILISCGLFPLPERNPLNARVTETVKHNDYSVYTVYFEARPGFYVTGNLYKPHGDGPFPAVLNPHGHWEHGRLEDSSRGSVPARCITLARMGMVALAIDMLGYNDSLQYEHGWADDRLKLWGIHPFGLQLWSAIRAIDFLEELPYVDRTRITCTGASGGGTQTFTLTAVDDRIQVSAPVNMISSTMQGGCVCENAPLIRLTNSNMEIAALMAPRPLLLISATGDWTRETPRVEYPAIRSIYDLYGASHRVKNVHVDAGHNFNLASREAMYRFFAQWVLNRDTGPVTEPAYQMEDETALRVFPGNVLPNESPTAEELTAWIKDDTRDKWRAAFPHDRRTLREFQHTHGPALQSTLGVEIPTANELAAERVFVQQYPGYVVEHWILGRSAHGDRIPAIFYRSNDADPQDAVLLVHGQGKHALAGASGAGLLVDRLVNGGKAVLVIDTFLTGEHHVPLEETRRITVGAFHDTFNLTDTACRIQDVLTSLAWLRSRRDLTGRIGLVGLEAGGVWALFASAVDGKADVTIVDLNQFNPDDDNAWVQHYYLPAIRGIGDLHTAIALLAPRRLWLTNTGSVHDYALAKRAYQAVMLGALRVTENVPDHDLIASALQ